MRTVPPLFTATSAGFVPAPQSPPATTTKVDARATAPYPTLDKTPLSTDQADALAAELDTLYHTVMSSLDGDDARYIQRVYAGVVYFYQYT